MDSKETRLRLLELVLAANESSKAGATLHQCFMAAKEMVSWVERGEILVHRNAGPNLRLGDKVRTKASQHYPLGFDGQITADAITEHGRFITIRPERGESEQFKVEEVELA